MWPQITQIDTDSGKRVFRSVFGTLECSGPHRSQPISNSGVDYFGQYFRQGIERPNVDTFSLLVIASEAWQSLQPKALGDMRLPRFARNDKIGRFDLKMAGSLQNTGMSIF